MAFFVYININTNMFENFCIVFTLFNLFGVQHNCYRCREMFENDVFWTWWMALILVCRLVYAAMCKSERREYTYNIYLNNMELSLMALNVPLKLINCLNSWSSQHGIELFIPVSSLRGGFDTFHCFFASKTVEFALIVW